MRYAVIALLLSAAGWARAQNNILSGEYWFDENHDINYPLDIADAEYASLSTTIDLGSLGLGQHSIHYRVRDTQGQWSAVLTKHFTKKQEGPYLIQAGEYWFDTNYDDHAPLAVTTGSDIDLDQDIDVSGLQLGQHRVHYRLRDNHGNWSAVLSKAFTLKESGPFYLVQYRYWTEQTASPSDMHYVPFDPQAQFIDLNTAVAFCSGTVTGTQPVYFQIQDNHGHWSSVVKPNVNVNIAQTNTEPGTPTGLFVPGNGEFEPGMTYTITVSPPVAGASGYNWVLPAGWSGSSNTGTIVVTTPDPISAGPLSIGVSAVNDCGEGSTFQYWILSTGVVPPSEHNNVQLMPNPTVGTIAITGIGARTIDRLTIHNATGQLVQDLRPAQSDRLALDLSTEANGLYTVRIIQGEHHTKLQVMVQH